MKRIAIDMDEVIADVNHRFIEWYDRDFKTVLSVDQMNGKHFREIVPAEHLEKVRSYPHTDGFFQGLRVMPDSQRVISELSKKYEIFIASAAMEFKYSLLHKHKWMTEHFPFISWKNIVLCGDKSIINADYLIDDHAYHFKNFHGQGILFDSPHNMNEEWNPRVKNWNEVGELLL